MDLDQRARGFGGNRGRIILLGDGTEVLTDSDDADMFDTSAEDKDAKNQVNKATPDTSDVDSSRSEREGTPGPQEHQKSNEDTSNVQVKAVSDGPNKDS